MPVNHLWLQKSTELQSVSCPADTVAYTRKIYTVQRKITTKQSVISAWVEQVNANSNITFCRVVYKITLT